MRGLIWLNNIFRDEDGIWKINCVFKEKTGFEKKHVQIESIPSQIIDTDDFHFHRISTRAQPFSCYDLSKAELLMFPEEIIGKFVPDNMRSLHHAIYKMGDEERPVYVPAFLLIRSLFTGSKLLDRCLMWPGAVDLLGINMPESDEVYIKGSSLMRTLDMTGRFSRLMAWMLTRKDARKAHASVLEFARYGKIDMELPEISISGWARGIEVGKGILAVSLNALDICYPLPQDKIRLEIKNKSKVFKSYESPVRSPWSIHRRLEK